MTKRKRTQIPALLRAAHIDTPYAHYCEMCRVEVGRTSHPALPNAAPLVCSKCRKAIREGIAA